MNSDKLHSGHTHHSVQMMKKSGKGYADCYFSPLNHDILTFCEEINQSMLLGEIDDILELSFVKSL